jgi:hypothetical protein
MGGYELAGPPGVSTRPKNAGETELMVVSALPLRKMALPFHSQL